MAGWTSRADGEEAVRIIEACDKLLDARQPRHLGRSPEDNRLVASIIEEQIRLGERACARGDIAGFRVAYATLVRRLFEIYERQEREHALQGTASEAGAP